MITENIIKTIKNTFRKLFLDLSIIADSSDSSISLSEDLLSFVRNDLGSIGKVSARIVKAYDWCYKIHFYIQFFPYTEDKVLYSSTLQRNDFYDSIGFETLCPTVNYILYNYGIEEDVKKLKVKPRLINNTQFYEILRP